jgi:tetratricopeptide (TPR) repeat protein
MKKQLISLIIILSMLIAWSSCEDYATGVDPLIDRVEDERLNSEDQIEFVITGVKVQFGFTVDDLLQISDLLSDAMFFDANLPGASYPTYADIDVGEITFDNNSVDGPYNNVGELRFFADDLIRRVGEVDFTDESLKNEALFWGNLFGGIARYLYAAYFGLTQEQGGGIISIDEPGPFIPSADMYDLALEKYNAALSYAGDDYLKRVVNSLIARIHLFEGDYANAATFAQNGMVQGDEPFQSLYNMENWNQYYAQAGRGRWQCGADYRFNDYITADPNEANRILIEEVVGNDGTTIYYGQVKYPEQGSPITFISWQENELMLAETEIRAGNNAGALTRINNVRASHGIDALTAVDLDVLYQERDKELCFTGIRLVDQRRFNKWHLGPGTWKYFPITQSERNINPNIGP